MITVRYPDGTEFQYHAATHVREWGDGWQLSTADPEKGGRTVALIQGSAGAIVEFQRPNRLANALTSQSGDAALQHVAADLRAFREPRHHQYLAGLKRQLADYDARTNTWREQ